MELNVVIKKIETGDIPKSLKDKALAINSFNEFQKKLAPASAILIASARRENFAPNDDGAREWIAWAKDNFGFNDSYIHQMRKVGNMLLDTMAENKTLYKELLSVGFDKLYYISRLDLDPFNKFVQENDLHSLSRDEIRDAVNEELGGAPSKSPAKKADPTNPNNLMWQPGFCDIVNEVAGWDEEFTAAAAEDNSIDPWVAARGGLSLIDISIRRIKGGATLQKEFKEALIKTLEDDIEELRSIKEN